MRITVDADRCQGHNRCHALAPSLFDVDDYGYATATATATAIAIAEASTAELERAARLAEANCPEHAINIEP